MVSETFWFDAAGLADPDAEVVLDAAVVLDDVELHAASAEIPTASAAMAAGRQVALCSLMFHIFLNVGNAA
jgi:hypothetical protein